MKDCCKKSYDDGLQKGKEIGKQDVLNNYTDFKFLKDLDTMAFHRGERSQASKIAELEKENNRLKNLVTKIDAIRLTDELESINPSLLGHIKTNDAIMKIVERLRGEK